MKKLFTLFALLACFLGAKAEWVEDYSIDYSTHTGFPFYVMGYVPEWFSGIMTDFGAMYKYVQVTDDAEETSSVIVKTEAGVEYYKIELSSPGWHQYFIADGIPTEIGQGYTVKALVKASETVTINVNMGWGWGDGQQASASVTIPASDDFQEVEWEYGEINGSSCNLVAQPGSATAVIEWKSLTVSHNAKDVRPVEWIELIQNGDAEKSWAELGLADVAYNDMENNYKICAWGKEKGVNLNDDGGWDPFPATIETESGNTSNHVFVVHGKEATTEGDASAWDNQFWIQCPQEMKAGTQVKLKFRYKASKEVKVATQTHYQTPSNYLIWHCAGDVTFTEEWQTYDQTVTFGDDMGGGWSCAFQLNQNDKEAIDFYFDDLSWQIMKLDEGYFVAASNSNTGIAYDFDNAIEFTPDDDVLVATVGTAGKQNTWVNEVMISTVRGYDASFRGATIKPSGTVDGDPDTWLDYTASSNAKIKLPAAGVWTITIDTAGKQVNFVKVEGEENKQPIEINPNPYVVVVNGVERDDLSDGTNQDGSVNVRENEGGTGETWDNQFFIMANRALDAGEETVISFKYKGSRDATVTTQCHNEPGQYMHWSAIGNIDFTTEEQEFSYDFTIPSEANGMKTIAFNMAEIKEACDYTIWDVVWKLKDNTESLINQEGGQNYYIKVGAGTNPEVADGIEEIVTDGAVKGNGAIYNIAGQRVDSSYKGVVIKNGKKYIAK